MELIVQKLDCRQDQLILEGCSSAEEMAVPLFLKAGHGLHPLCFREEGRAFSVRIPLDGVCCVSFRIVGAGGEAIPGAMLVPGPEFPIGSLRHGYVQIGAHLLERTGEGLAVKPCTVPRRLRMHCLMVFQLLRTGALRAAACQLCIPLLRLFLRKQIWLISDRMNQAGDNGEAMYRHLVQEGPKDVLPVFAISRSSQKYRELREIGKVVDIRSFRYQLVFLLSRCIVSSQASESVRNPLGPWREQYANLVINQKFVFLQHGVTQHDMSRLFARRCIHADMICAATYREHQEFLSDRYGYSPKEARLTGFARFDRLYSQPEKIITIIPTWRKSLVTEQDAHTGARYACPGFEQSAYVRAYEALLNHPSLLQAVRAQGYRLQVVSHPNMTDVWQRMHLDGSIELLTGSTDYAAVLAHGALMITDYSSVAFDFAYLEKPVLYFQFDRDEVFSGAHTYGRECPDYAQVGLGEAAETADELVRLILEYLSGGCRMKPLYRQRVRETFRFTDRQNARRIAREIRQLCGAQDEHA